MKYVLWLFMVTLKVGDSSPLPLRDFDIVGKWWYLGKWSKYFQQYVHQLNLKLHVNEKHGCLYLVLFTH